MLQEGADAREAAEQLSLKYLHVSQAKTGLLDAFIATFAEAEARGLNFRDWVKDELDPAEITARFQSRGWANHIIDDLLRRE